MPGSMLVSGPKDCALCLQIFPTFLLWPALDIESVTMECNKM